MLTRNDINRARWRVALATLVVCVFAHFVGLPVYRWFSREPYLVTSLIVGLNYRIDLIAQPDPGWDTGPGLYYELWRGNKRMTERQYFGVTYRPTGELRFEALVLENGKLVAVYERSTPECLDVLCDLESGEYWPCPRAPGDSSFASEYAIRDRLVNRVRSSRGDRRYKCPD